jgi:hypothetical protein
MTKRLPLALFLALVPASVGAQDASGIYGNVYGCKVAAFASGSWTQLASSDLKDTSTGAALSAGLYLSSLSIVSRDAWGGASAFLCLGPSATCPASTTDAPRIDGGTAKSIEVRGVLSGPSAAPMTTLAIRGNGASATLEVCAHYRKAP